MPDRERVPGRHRESVVAGCGAGSVSEHGGVNLFDS
jgi:hypothetical protein